MIPWARRRTRSLPAEPDRPDPGATATGRIGRAVPGQRSTRGSERKDRPRWAHCCRPADRGHRDRSQPRAEPKRLQRHRKPNRSTRLYLVEPCLDDARPGAVWSLCRGDTHEAVISPCGGRLGGIGQGERQDEPVVVVRELANEVDPSWGRPDSLWRPPEDSSEVLAVGGEHSSRRARDKLPRAGFGFGPVRMATTLATRRKPARAQGGPGIWLMALEIQDAYVLQGGSPMVRAERRVDFRRSALLYSAKAANHDKHAL